MAQREWLAARGAAAFPTLRGRRVSRRVDIARHIAAFGGGLLRYALRHALSHRLHGGLCDRPRLCVLDSSCASARCRSASSVAARVLDACSQTLDCCLGRILRGAPPRASCAAGCSTRWHSRRGSSCFEGARFRGTRGGQASHRGRSGGGALVATSPVAQHVNLRRVPSHLCSGFGGRAEHECATDLHGGLVEAVVSSASGGTTHRSARL